MWCEAPAPAPCAISVLAALLAAVAAFVVSKQHKSWIGLGEFGALLLEKASGAFGDVGINREERSCCAKPRAPLTNSLNKALATSLAWWGLDSPLSQCTRLDASTSRSVCECFLSHSHDVKLDYLNINHWHMLSRASRRSHVRRAAVRPGDCFCPSFSFSSSSPPPLASTHQQCWKFGLARYTCDCCHSHGTSPEDVRLLLLHSAAG